ncbi:aminotransferase class V-fold PLP-dependent enzyme [Shewanella pneumatophori]|uniref:Aminotransferase class V-fold PLP-dependent enzyme n=1 Tax=Shewanella pneumatophori TaxID=314092 RepID=A0A9X1ZD87_9GAMM|nr:aminotransferase class V-fold PLP-dependent enzyme [Shewanella pneumatophori]MCL1139421.1 aminotransferase class V-fold PLP-dependent enzyme [Shewanella pneumatophori]
MTNQQNNLFDRDQLQNEQLQSNERRRFLKTTTGLAITAAGASLLPASAHASTDDFNATFHGNHADQRFWNKVRKEFILNKRNTYMNIGTAGTMPKRVLKDYNHANEQISINPWNSNIPTLDYAKQIAPSFGADPHELVLCRNTTDGLCTIINGLQFEYGDIILTTNHEHHGVTTPLKHVAERYGAEVIELALPVYTPGNDVSVNDFVQVFADAVNLYGSRVRLMVFSHVTFTTGTTLPAQQICKRVAIPNGIVTLVDGAHTPGMFNLDFHDIDCDFYSGAGHKWQCGPGATGFLYVRDNASRLFEFWSDRETPLWFINTSSSSVEVQTKLQSVGQDNYPAKRALAKACEMWDEIGRDAIEKRILDLSALCKEELARKFPDAMIFAPNVRKLSSGLTTFNPFDDLTDSALLTEFRDRLDEEYGYIVRTTSFYLDPNDSVKTYSLRISTHLFHDDDDVKGLVKAMKQLYREMR